MGKRGGGEKRTEAGVVPFRGRQGGAEPSYAGGAEAEAVGGETPVGKAKRKARVVPIARGRAIAAAGPRVRARAGRVEVAAAAEPAEETETRARRMAPEYRAAPKLAGKVALITGGDGVLGQAVAGALAREGADAAVVYAPGELSGAEAVRQEIEAVGQHALLLAGDVREPDFCKQAVERAVTEYGQLDVVVHTARYAAQGQTIEAVRYEDWEAAFKSSVYSYFLVAQAAAPRLARGGAIIAAATTEGPARQSALLPLDFAATQGAMHAFTRALAQQLSERGIRVNAVMGFGAKAEDVAAACLFFASAKVSGEMVGVG